MGSEPCLDTRVPAIKRVNGADVTPSGGPYGLFSAEAYLVLTPEPVLVDCGGPPTYPELRANLSALGVAPSDIRYVIATHFHGDHCGNVVALRGEAPHVPFAIHAADVAAFSEARGPDGERPGADGPRPDARLARVDRPLRDGERLTVGRATFEALHTPGHTEGSAAIRVEVDGVRAVFVGDTVHGLYFPRQGCDVWADMRRWARSLARLAEAPFDLLFEGHVLPVHVLGNPSALAEAEQADLYALVERRMRERRRGIERADALEIIAAQQRLTEAGLLITPEAWIPELAARRAGRHQVGGIA